MRKCRLPSASPLTCCEAKAHSARCLACIELPLLRIVLPFFSFHSCCCSCVFVVVCAFGCFVACASGRYCVLRGGANIVEISVRIAKPRFLTSCGRVKKTWEN